MKPLGTLIGLLLPAGAHAAAEAPPAGTYACFTREILYIAGERAGERETLEGGAYELDIITDSKLLWQYEDANSLHNGLPLEIDYRPQGREELLARTEGGLVIRVILGLEPMRFAALDTRAAMIGICHFKPRDT